MSDAPSDSRKAVADKVLDGADEVTRRKMEAMLKRSSVVEVMAQAHASGKPAAVEDRPIKPDFLSTDEYELARKAIGATGEPVPSSAKPAIAPSTSRPSEKSSGDNALPDPLATGKRSDSAPMSEEDNVRRNLIMLAVAIALIVAAIMLWPKSRDALETKPRSIETRKPMVLPTATQHAALPEPRPTASPSEPSAMTTAAPPPPSTASVPSPPPSPQPSAQPPPHVQPSARPSAKPSASPPDTSNTSRFRVQGND